MRLRVPSKQSLRDEIKQTKDITYYFPFHPLAFFPLSLSLTLSQCNTATLCNINSHAQIASFPKPNFIQADSFCLSLTHIESHKRTICHCSGCPLSFWHTLTNSHTHTRTLAHTHTRTHAHSQTHSHTRTLIAEKSFMGKISLSTFQLTLIFSMTPLCNFT